MIEKYFEKKLYANMLHSLLKVKNVGPNFLRAQNPRRYIYCYSNLVYSTSRFDNCAAAALR